jgi:hypothetical protein
LKSATAYARQALGFPELMRIPAEGDQHSCLTSAITQNRPLIIT